jgi:methylenetetrahydrofolate dehydrogenase (NADP+)/methenyltetrahydrofolate cyclohydrolase
VNKINPSEISSPFRKSIRNEIEQNKYIINIVGFLCTEDPAARKYADYTKVACDDVGMNFELRIVPRLELESEILKANDDKNIHGIFIYYPIFNVEQDAYLKNLVSPYKDIEGLNQYWSSKLYKNDRYENGDETKKALLPCTPLAIVKMLSYLDVSPVDKTITVFNRSEVVGRPLATMLSHDGAEVISFDEHGPLLFKKEGVSEIEITREEALKKSDIVITGVPSKSFRKVRGEELKDHAVAINFSTVQNFENQTLSNVSKFVPRVGPLTVTMCLRNALRLYKNYSIG